VRIVLVVILLLAVSLFAIDQVGRARLRQADAALAETLCESDALSRASALQEVVAQLAKQDALPPPALVAEAHALFSLFEGRLQAKEVSPNQLSISLGKDGADRWRGIAAQAAELCPKKLAPAEKHAASLQLLTGLLLFSKTERQEGGVPAAEPVKPQPQPAAAAVKQDEKAAPAPVPASASAAAPAAPAAPASSAAPPAKAEADTAKVAALVAKAMEAARAKSDMAAAERVCSSGRVSEDELKEAAACTAALAAERPSFETYVEGMQALGPDPPSGVRALRKVPAGTVAGAWAQAELTKRLPVVVKKALSEGKTSLESGDAADAQRLAEFVLEVDPGNAEAVALKKKAAQAARE
jgi:hypothetical protein